jgi:hypothetical protein
LSKLRAANVLLFATVVVSLLTFNTRTRRQESTIFKSAELTMNQDCFSVNQTFAVQNAGQNSFNHSLHAIYRGPQFLPALAQTTSERLLQFRDSAVSQLEHIYECVSQQDPVPFTDQFGKDRRPSYPFNCADGFRQLCRHRCEPHGCSFSVGAVQNGDCIFVSNTALNTFKTTTEGVKALSRIYRDIKVPFFVVSGSGDLSQPDGDKWHVGEAPLWAEQYSYMLDFENLKAWFASNCHWMPESKPKPEKIHCIPIGIENRYSSIGREPRAYLKDMRQPTNSTPSKLLLVDFKPMSIKPWRDSALKALQHEWVTVLQPHLSHEAWRKLVQDHKWVACPPGHGYDTHRVWEVLMLGSVPVVPSTSMDSLYEGLPVLIVNDWHNLTAERLHERYEELRTEAWNLDRLFFPYWLARMVDLGLNLPPGPVFEYLLGLHRTRSLSHVPRVHSRPLHPPSTRRSEGV